MDPYKVALENVIGIMDNPDTLLLDVVAILILAIHLHLSIRLRRPTLVSAQSLALILLGTITSTIASLDFASTPFNFKPSFSSSSSSSSSSASSSAYQSPYGSSLHHNHQQQHHDKSRLDLDCIISPSSLAVLMLYVPRLLLLFVATMLAFHAGDGVRCIRYSEYLRMMGFRRNRGNNNGPTMTAGGRVGAASEFDDGDEESGGNGESNSNSTPTTTITARRTTRIQSLVPPYVTGFMTRFTTYLTQVKVFVQHLWWDADAVARRGQAVPWQTEVACGILAASIVLTLSDFRVGTQWMLVIFSLFVKTFAMLPWVLLVAVVSWVSVISPNFGVNNNFRKQYSSDALVSLPLALLLMVSRSAVDLASVAARRGGFMNVPVGVVFVGVTQLVLISACLGGICGVLVGVLVARFRTAREAGVLERSRSRRRRRRGGRRGEYERMISGRVGEGDAFAHGHGGDGGGGVWVSAPGSFVVSLNMTRRRSVPSPGLEAGIAMEEHGGGYFAGGVVDSNGNGRLSTSSSSQHRLRDALFLLPADRVYGPPQYEYHVEGVERGPPEGPVNHEHVDQVYEDDDEYYDDSDDEDEFFADEEWMEASDDDDSGVEDGGTVNNNSNAGGNGWYDDDSDEEESRWGSSHQRQRVVYSDGEDEDGVVGMVTGRSVSSFRPVSTSTESTFAPLITPPRQATTTTSPNIDDLDLMFLENVGHDHVGESSDADGYVTILSGEVEVEWRRRLRRWRRRRRLAAAVAAARLGGGDLEPLPVYEPPVGLKNNMGHGGHGGYEGVASGSRSRDVIWEDVEGEVEGDEEEAPAYEE
ncbi:hypothetical protein HDU76_002592 [Blyttiomyces sp. JEL0837]|nr:hypothetical protein HDU76_002592 [Blyttiomyces sp. JEL0837]